MTKEELYGGKKKKPRLVEVLGVEVNEEWVLEPSIFSNTINRIDADGYRETKDADGNWAISGWESLLAEAINHPERIKRLTHWTAEECEKAKAIKVLFPNAGYMKGNGATVYVRVYDNQDEKIMGFLDENKQMFPHLKGDEPVMLDEILEAELKGADNNDR